MSAAEKTPPTELIEVPRSLMPELRRRYGKKIRLAVRLVAPGLEDELVSVHESRWYKEISATRTPGRALRVYRENRGLSQSELARKLGPTRKQYVADMEAGRRGISKEMAKKLAEILNAPVERLL